MEYNWDKIWLIWPNVDLVTLKTLLRRGSSIYGDRGTFIRGQYITKRLPGSGEAELTVD